MKRLLLLLGGLGAVSITACNAPTSAEVQDSNTTVLAVTGMT